MSVDELNAHKGKEKDWARWTTAEVDAMLDYLYEHRSEMADGGTFKDSTWSGVTQHIADLLVSGSVKTGDRCKSKYAAVCILSTSAPVY